MKKQVYIIEVFYIPTKYTSTSGEGYDTKEKAISFIKSKLNEDDIKFNTSLQKRGLLEWYEYHTSNYIYEIKPITIV